MRIEKIAELVRRAESLSDLEARGVAAELLQAALEFHAAGLERILQIIADSGDTGRGLVQRIGADELAGSILLLHDLHPDDLETRVDRAVRRLQELFRSLGAKLALVGIENGTVHLRFESAKTWSRAAVLASIENKILEAAPEVSRVAVEGIKETAASDFVPLSQLAGVASAPRAAARGHSEHEKCELCSAPVGEQHQHLVDPSARRLLCACDPCAILFSGSGETKYRRVPRDVRSLSNFTLSDQAWNSLAIPTGLAFIYSSSAAGQTLAVYPSPAGPTEAVLDRDSWAGVVQENPELARLAPDVEALMVNRMNGVREYFWAPIDECYRLAGLVRKYWRGFSGGEEGRQRIAEFFDGLKERSYAGSLV